MRRAVMTMGAALVLAAGMLVHADPCRAQETQVPFDRAGRFRTIDAHTAHRAGLFADSTRGFQEARLFRLPDSSYVLELTSLRQLTDVRDRAVLRERSPLTAAEADALRDRFEALVHARRLEPAISPEGSVPLIVGSAVLGVGFYSWAVPLSFMRNGEELGAGPYLLSLSTSFFLPWLVSSQSSVTYAMSNLTLYGATRGIAHGALMHTLAGGDNGGGVDDHPGVRAAVIGSLVEGTACYLWAREDHMSNGTATTIATFGDFGMLEAGFGADLAGGFDGSADDHRTARTSIVAGGVAGMLAGRVLAAHRDYTFGDASVMRTAGILGTWAGLAVANAEWEGSGSNHAGSAAVMIGTAAGLAVGDRLVAHTSYDASSAVLMELGTFAGGLLGLGITSSVPSTDHDAAPLLAGSLLGAIGGFALTNSQYAPAARRAAAEGTSWNVDVQPTGLAATTPEGRRTLVPAVAVRCRF